MKKQLLSALVLAIPFAVAASAEVKSLSGEVKTGEVLDVTDKAVRLKIEDKETTLPAAELVSVDLLPAARPLPSTPFLLVRLIDGTLLKCQGFGLAGKNAKARLFNGLDVQFPASSLHWVLCEAHDARNRQEFDELLAKKPQQDQLRLLSRDGQAVNLFEGFVGEADAQGQAVDFTPESGNKTIVAMARVRGMIFARKADDKATPAVCKVHDAFENVFFAHAVETSVENFQISTPSGLQVGLPRPLVQRFDFSLGKIAYLSDLEPVRLEEQPILADLWHYRRDKNLEGEPLTLMHEEKKEGRVTRATRTHAKGLALHSRTVIEYDVNGFSTFRSWIGIDPRVTGPAHAIVRFEGDGKPIFETPLTGTDAAKDLNLPVSGIARLRIVVDYGEDLDLGDHVILAEARVMK